MAEMQSLKRTPSPGQAAAGPYTSSHRADSAALTALHGAPHEQGDDYPAWQPHEVGVYLGEDGKWHQPYGTNGQYEHVYDKEPACSRTNTEIAKLLGESGLAWGTFRAIVKLQSSHNAEENSLKVREIVYGVRDPKVCRVLRDAFALRAGDERQSSQGWGGAGGNCNMLGIYGSAVTELTARLEQLLADHRITQG
jgi:hypothetical protein